MAESFEELECSYQLIKFGFYKQAFISLRVALDIGLFSIYWSILGTENVDFKKWLSSKKDTPFKNKSFWDVLRANNSIHTFDHNYDLIREIKNLGFSDFVHTKGLMYSNFGEFQRKIRGKDKFENFRYWTHNFKQVVRTLSILHLLKFPSLTLRYSTDYLLARFGTFDRIPIFGGGYGDEMKNISSFIESGQLEMINELASKDPEVIEIKNWLEGLPELNKDELYNIVLEDAKKAIPQWGGFEKWRNSPLSQDDRIDTKMFEELRNWSLSQKSSGEN
ncbi:MAG: hypothetical protein RIC15_08370 [Vicingaceae bacterium]